MRRYELMLILRPDVADDRAKAIFERTARSITEQGGKLSIASDSLKMVK